MALSSSLNRKQFTATAGQTVFAFNEVIYFDQTHLQVYVDGTLKTLTSHYTVSPKTNTPNGTPGGTVTFLLPLAGGEQVTIMRVVPLVQTIDYQENEKFPANTHEKGLDYLTMITHQLAEEHGRQLTLPVTETPSAGLLTLPSTADRASKYFGWNSSGEPIALDATSASGTSVTATGSPTARFLADRAADWSNVLDYGAVGDGVADDRPAFVLTNTNAKLAFIPKGDYTFASPFSTTAAAWLPDPTMTWADLTGSGQFGLQRGFWTDSGNGANIWRFADRVLVGDAINCSGDTGATSTSWLGVSPQPGIGWIEKNATFASFASTGSIAIAGAARTSQMTGGAALGLAGVSYNDEEVSSCNAWGLYVDSKATANAVGATWGIEVETTNMGVYTDLYSGSTRKHYGIVLAAGGDPVINGTTDSCTVAQRITNNGANWGRGIEFGATSLRSFVDAGGSTHYKAIMLRNAMQLGWEDSSGDSLGFIRSGVSVSASETSIRLQNNNIYLDGYANTTISQFGTVASAVNYLYFQNDITGFAPRVSVAGADTDIDLRLIPKGTGVVRFGTHSAIAAETVTGYITIKDAGGTSRKVAVVS